MNYAYKVTYKSGRKRTDFFHDRDQLIRYYAKQEANLKNIARINIPGEGDKGRLERGEERFDGIMREIALMRRIVKLEAELKKATEQAARSSAP